MNIFDTEYTSLKNYNNNNAVSDTTSHNFNKELCSFDFMFNSNTFSSYDPFKQKSDVQQQQQQAPVNSFSNLTNYNGNCDFIGTSLIQNDNKNMVNNTDFNSFSSDNYSFLNGLSFDKTQQPPPNQQSWSNIDHGQWSNGNDTPTTSANSFINKPQTPVPIGSSPASSGSFISQNSVLSSSPGGCIAGSQSRLMSYMNSQTPPANLTSPPLSNSPNFANSQAASIENMKIKDFLHRPPSNGSLKSPSIEGSLPTSLPTRDTAFSLDKDDVFGGNHGNSFAFSPKEGSDSLFTNFLQGSSFNSLTLNEDKVSNNQHMEEDINVWDSLDNFR